ncbi:MAG: hypothetical protein QN141_02525 [Armatimonadota bacterium]|nr:hypothetical protein [Armatimonadota bacterium]MDR7466131.1 hypothetical protein [Armatimonadota bacterium]MDR7493832.1 hypothetical protein [Armatimonadota bacterium]MDR7499007.1 hypothetical protein [Armatimonadota bacterium]MDR7504797.1 hypothetical protein [Armatimonadota bacterium]
MTVDVTTEIKTKARAVWAKGAYGESARNLVEVSAHLVRAAGVGAGDRVLDVATGTGITAITARRTGAYLAPVKSAGVDTAITIRRG